MPAAPSQYLEQADYATFGLPGTTTAAQVIRASAMIDGHLKRPEGLVWEADATGNPLCMSALTPKRSLTASGAIAPGSAVVVPFTGPVLTNDDVGSVVVLDRADNTKAEPCVITAVAPGTVTLQTVAHAHNSGCKLDCDLVIMEQKTMPRDRSVTRLARPQPVKVLSGVGRYGYGRRDQQLEGNVQEFNLLATVSSFGGPPLWIPWDPSVSGISYATGEIWVPAGVLLAYYSDVRIWYLAGFPKAGIPYDLKQACANVVMQVQNTGFDENVQSRGSRDGVRVQKFENTLIPANTRDMLVPYKARLAA